MSITVGEGRGERGKGKGKGRARVVLVFLLLRERPPFEKGSERYGRGLREGGGRLYNPLWREGVGM